MCIGGGAVTTVLTGPTSWGGCPGAKGGDCHPGPLAPGGPPPTVWSGGGELTGVEGLDE